MKIYIHRTIKNLKVPLIMLLLLVIYAVLYHYPSEEAYFIAFQNNIHVTEIRFGPYYRITEGIDENKEFKYIVKINSNKQNYIISQSDGITQEEALQIAKKNGYTNEHGIIKLEISTNRIGKLDNKNAVLKNLVWHLSYDSSNGLYVEIDFETGALFNFPRKLSLK